MDVINLIKVLAKLHPQINFIFRPHPRQNPEIIKKRFTSINNIKVIYKGTITPWIKACDLFMHSGCTSVLEAITMDKKIISFVSNKNEFRNNFYYKFGYHFNEEEILISNFLKILKKKKPLKKNVTPYVYNLKKKFFYDQFINYLKNSNFDISIKKINYEKERPNLFKNVLINLKSLFLKISFFDKFLFIFKTNFLLSNEYRKKKIEKITKKEIKDFLKKINNVLGKKNIFLISKLDANLFKISMK